MPSFICGRDFIPPPEGLHAAVGDLLPVPFGRQFMTLQGFPSASVLRPKGYTRIGPLPMASTSSHTSCPLLPFCSQCPLGSSTRPNASQSLSMLSLLCNLLIHHQALCELRKEKTTLVLMAVFSDHQHRCSTTANWDESAV